MWLKIDDSFSSHPKVRNAGKDGRALWLAAATLCARQGSDVIDTLGVKDAAHLAEVTPKKSALLVECGLWHDHTQGCERCEPAPVGSFRFHDWWDYQPTKDEAHLPSHVIKWRRKKELQRDRDLCERIIKRDRNRCRYCGERVEWKDRKSPRGGTYDHVDPDGDNSLRNVVVACRGCNIAKGERTPEEAGMVLIDLTGARSGQKSSDPNRQLSGLHARGGDGPDPGRIRSDRGQVVTAFKSGVAEGRG